MTENSSTHYARSADGTHVAYQVTGNGPLDLAFLVTANPPIDLMWEDPGLLRVRRRLGSFTRTIWCDARGGGASEGNPVDANQGRLFDADLTAVLDAVGCERVALFGWSDSGPRAIHFAATHPERVSALILFNTYAHYVRDDGYPWGFPARSLDRILGNLKATWGTGTTLDIVAPSRVADDRFAQWLARSQRLGVGPELLGEAVRASYERDVRPLLSTIRVPALVLHREGNRYIQVGAGRYIAEHLQRAKFVALSGDDHLFFVGDHDALLDEVEEFLTGRHEAPEGDVVLATILFTDIVESTQQAAQLGPRAWSTLSQQHDALIRAALQRHRGREVRTIGDSFLATFNAGAEAVRCALEIVRGVKALGVQVRAGLHTGEIEVRRDDIAGLGVVIAKRVCDLARPEQVLVSETVKGLVVGSELTFSDQGTHVLKGVPDEWRLFAAHP
jgi:class 3 adenylate cyclase